MLEVAFSVVNKIGIVSFFWFCLVLAIDGALTDAGAPKKLVKVLDATLSVLIIVLAIWLVILINAFIWAIITANGI